VQGEKAPQVNALTQSPEELKEPKAEKNFNKPKRF